jgi:L-iditol 2-dehydrogenase
LRKLVWEGGDNFCLEEHVPIPTAAAGEVLIRTTAVGICGTDIHILDGRLSLGRAPLVLGHEIAGVVAQIGPGVQQVHENDRVTVDQVIGCGKCAFCKRGSRQFCESGVELGITIDGGCQEFLVVPEENVFPLPATISDEAGAILDMEVWAALSKCGVSAGESVLVLGDGPAGLIACQAAKLMGAAYVVVSGPPGHRMRKAKELELADCFLSSDDPGLLDRLRSEVGRHGVDVAMDCAGVEESSRTALKAVRPGGRVVLYGVQAAPLSHLDLNTIVLRDLVVYGALSDRNPWEKVIDLAASGRLQLEPLITHRYTLENAPSAYQAVRHRSNGLIKAVIVL